MFRYLLSYDSITFHSYLEAILTAATPKATKGPSANPRTTNESPWLYLDAANTLFHVAKRRAYIPPPRKKKAPPPAAVVNETGGGGGDEDEEEALREAERAERETTGFGGRGQRDWEDVKEGNVWPPGVEPVLEELPKWGLLASVLEEIEEDIAVAKHSERCMYPPSL
jgi:DNA excision repair protein ERCC-4